MTKSQRRIVLICFGVFFTGMAAESYYGHCGFQFNRNGLLAAVITWVVFMAIVALVTHIAVKRSEAKKKRRQADIME